MSFAVSLVSINRRELLVTSTSRNRHSFTRLVKVFKQHSLVPNFVFNTTRGH
jgi:hypothetical protein